MGSLAPLATLGDLDEPIQLGLDGSPVFPSAAHVRVLAAHHPEYDEPDDKNSENPRKQRDQKVREIDRGLCGLGDEHSRMTLL
jgi:hypothetical protein